MKNAIDKLTTAAKTHAKGIKNPDSGQLSGIARAMNSHFKGNADYKAACREVVSDAGRTSSHMTGPLVATLLNVDWEKAQPPVNSF